MPNFGELQPNSYYLVQVDAESDIELISLILSTKETVLLRSYLPQTEDFFKYKNEPVFKLVEELDADLAEQLESLYPQQSTEEYSEYEEDTEE